MSAPRYIYFIRPVGMDGPIKIGCSAKPRDRLMTFSAWSPFVLELIGTVPSNSGDEARLHHRFSELHLRKEWFMSSPLLRETIERILAGSSVAQACKDIQPNKPIRNQTHPVRTADRTLFLSYGNRIRKATHSLWKSGQRGNYRAPENIKLIMHNWRCDRMHNHAPIIPTKEQISQLDEFIANPRSFCTFEAWPAPTPRQVAA